MITKLRTTAAAIAVALLATASCARERPQRQDTTIARRLGESTASPGSDPNRPVARSIDTQEVSATISPDSPIAKPGPAPAATGTPAAPIAQRPSSPAPVAPPPQPGQPAQPAAPPAAPPSASDVGSPGVFAPPPAPTGPTAPTPTTPITTTPITPTPPRP